MRHVHLTLTPTLPLTLPLPLSWSHARAAQVHVAMNVLDRVEQDESAIPDNAAAPLRTLQAS